MQNVRPRKLATRQRSTKKKWVAPSKRIFLYGYKRASASLKKLQEAILSEGIPCVRRDFETKKPPQKYDRVIYWGRGNPSIDIAQDKLRTFEKLKEANVQIPDFTTDINTAKQWLSEEKKVLCRKLLRSSGGKGIVMATKPEELTPAPLYVKYQPKQKEFRVHVFKGEVLDVQEKRRKVAGNVDSFNKWLRNYDNGWVFCREGIVEPTGLRDIGRSAVAALGLEFGAVDIIYNEKSKKLFVLEINTAPGIEGATVTKYKDAILNANP